MIYRNKETNVYYSVDVIFYNAVKHILSMPEWMRISDYVDIKALKNIEFVKVTSKLRKVNEIN